mgnify:FL=1|tara:strand:- start:549 stop:881 length:333 start_codon:yes stop_codon:yes gene_type:complete
MAQGDFFDTLNPFQKILEETDLGRQIAFQTALPTGSPFGQQQFFQNLYKPVFSEYLGEVGRAGGQGQQVPSFQEFLGNIDFLEKYRQAPSYVTGTRTAPLASKGRFLYGM